jgi:hypothetical protein
MVGGADANDIKKSVAFLQYFSSMVIWVSLQYEGNLFFCWHSNGKLDDGPIFP